ncbi:MAG: lamin tail domain-containing protein [Myxococcales bacterium]|nr:lamin tail domain-containing protein [Myxococcales bacterium]
MRRSRQIFTGLLVLPLLAWCGAGCGGSSGSSCQGLMPGDLVISELFANPKGTDDGKEWFEIYNATTRPIELKNLELVSARADGTGETVHRMAQATIPAAGFFVLGSMLSSIKPEWVDYAYQSDLGGLRNDSGSLALRCGGVVIDRVIYENCAEGASKQFDGAQVPDAVANDTLTRWCDATVPYETDSLGTPGAPNENCAGISPTSCKENGQVRDVVKPVLGDLVIAEFMPDPSKVGDTAGEWFEIAVKRDVDLNGVEVGNTPGTVKFRVASLDCVKAQAGDFLLFARSGDPTLNGGLPTPKFVANVSQANSAGSLFVSHNGALLDQVSWTSAKAGKSRALDPGSLDPAANDDPGVWCDGQDAYGAGDLGTPGAANPSCGIVPPGKCLVGGAPRDKVAPAAGDLVISELMPNPAAVDDTAGEWFEIAVKRDVDLNGLQLGRDIGSITQTLPEGECLRVTAGSFVVFARNDDPATNGGLPRVDFVTTLSLVNTDGTLAVGIGGTLLDGVSWASSTSGASKSLSANHLDATENDTQSFWCDGQVAYGAGDKGSPGAANPACP